MTYPKRHWYVAASVAEIGSDPIGRTVCGEPIVLYRTSDGTVVGLDDRCPHRGYPLSAGTLCGDEIQCGYHGLRFTPDGRCSYVPGQDRIPTRARVSAATCRRERPVGLGLDGRSARPRLRRSSRHPVGRPTRSGHASTAWNSSTPGTGC